MLGVRISEGTDRAACGRCVHAETEEWTITSDTPVGPAMLDVPLLSRQLPGRLGCYVYPADAVFSLRNKKSTSSADFSRAVADEEAGVGKRQAWGGRGVLRHVTVVMSPEERPACQDEDRVGDGYHSDGAEDGDEDGDDEDHDGDEDEEEEEEDNGEEEADDGRTGKEWEEGSEDGDGGVPEAAKPDPNRRRNEGCRRREAK